MAKGKKRQKKVAISPQELPCEIPKCKAKMGKDGLLFYGKRVCAPHFAKDGKRGFSLRKIFGIKHAERMGGDLLFDPKCPICVNNADIITAREQKRANRKTIMKHPVPLPKGHAHTPIYLVIKQNKI